MRRIFTSVVVLYSLTTQAQVTDTTELLPVEIRTLRASATAPFAKTVLGRAALQRQNLVQDLPFVLNQTPSVVVQSDAGNGVGYTGIRIRGTDATRINVTVNGVPFNDPESGGTFFVNLPDIVSSASSIQIQRGVGTSTNGGGAFGGTINLSTNEQNALPYLESNNSYGSFYTVKNTLRMGTGNLGNYFSVDGRLSRISSNGFIERAATNLKSYFLAGNFSKGNTTVRLTSFSGKERTYQAWYGVAENDLGTNRRINYAGTEKPGEPYKNETDNYTQSHYQALLAQKLSARWEATATLFLVRGKGYYEQYKRNRKYADYGLPPVMSGTAVIERTDLVRQLWLDNYFYGTVYSAQHKTEKQTVSLGGAWSNYLGDHYGKVIWAEKGLATKDHRWYSNDALKNDWNLYAKVQQNLDASWQVFTDLQLRNVSYTINGFRDNPSILVKQQYRFLNPKAGITYTKNKLTAFASYSLGNKEPNRDDFEAATNELPRAERLHDWEAGVERKTKTATWSATVYYMKYRNQLVLTGKINDVGAYTRTNINQSYRLGAELQASVQAASWLRASGNATLSRNRISNLTEYLDDYDNGGQKSISYPETDISFSPNLTGAATLTIIPIQKASIDLLGKYVSRQYLDNTSNNNRMLKGYYTQDLRLGYVVTGAKLRRVEAVVQLLNVFNKQYESNGYTFSYISNNQSVTENFYYPMAGRQILVALNLHL